MLLYLVSWLNIKHLWGGGDGLKPNVSYVREDSKVYSTGAASEDFSGAVVYAKYNISEDMSKTGLFNTSNVKALKVDGEVMEFEPEVEMSSELTVLSENISFDMENETYNVPEEYLFDNSKLSSLVVRPANGDISAYNAVCISVSMSGMNNPMPLMFEDAEGMGVVVDYENNMIDLSPMLEMLSMYYPGNTSVCMLSVDENYETLVFGDTLVSFSGISGGMPAVFDFESAGEHELEVLLKDEESIGLMFANNMGVDYGLVEVVIPDSVKYLDEYCFSYDENLVKVTIPESVESIGAYCFDKCYHLTDVCFLGEGVKNIGDYAFKYCENLKAITLPDSIETLEYSAFYECRQLNSVKLPNGISTLNRQTFYNCVALDNVVIPDSVTVIDNSCFYGCSGLTSINLPKNLTSIGDHVFYGCVELKEIYALPSTPPTINISFIEVASNGVLYHPYGSDYSSWKVGGLANWEFVANLTITECTNLTITANNVKWDETTTTIHYTATVNGVDSLGNMVTDIVITGTTVSDEFEENQSDETVERVITFEYMGVTATTTILQTSNLKYLGFTAINDCGFTFTKNGNGESISFSIDNGVTWGSLISGMESPTIKAGESIYWKSNITPSDEGIGYFSSTGSFKAHGNVMSLLYGDDFEGQTSLEGKDEAFKNLFKNCYYLNDASSLILPATTLAEGCYYGIFYYCTSLTTAPELPATTLADNCYSWMFYNCTNLKTAPELPATTLVDYCYYCMFANCKSLTTAPELPATTLVNDCYNNMFFGCTSLNHITMLATDISANSCLLNWVKGVSSTGTFIKSYEVVALPIGQSGIPSDWTIENKFECEAVSLSITADNVACYMTSTTIHYESVVNLCNKDGEVVDTITVTGTAQSEPFPINTSETDIVERTISFTFCGKTATTTITQGVYTKPLTFVALEDGTFSYTKKGTGDDLQYSKDNGTTWTSLASGETISVVTGDKVLWKSKQYPKQVYGIGNFTSTGRFEARGNVMSLLFGDDYIEHTDLTGKYYAFNGLFSGCTNLTTAPELPATILENNCYDGMFSGCTNLTTAPELPATTLDSACYQNMFSACESLTTAPELPATTLGNNCYSSMFYGCTNLTTAPELPATTSATRCYCEMFRGCKSLTTAPELPATTLAAYCYSSMFYGCTNLTTAPELPATTSATRCYYGMFEGCKSLTTAPELPATTLADYCYQYMFNGCTSLITAPELPVTTLTEGCYYGMFAWCTSLSESPVLPATTSVKNCYHSMFYKCTSLITAPELPAATLAEKCYYAMFYGCSGLTTAPELPATTLAEGCYDSMFSHCENLTTAPELPATILADYCYCAMFSSCSKLTTAPELPATTLGNNCYDTMFAWCTSLSESPVLHATTLAEGCYMKMFYACTNIKRITMLATDISATDCLKDWVSHALYNCTFVKHPDMTSLPTGTSGIPNSWTVEDYQG